MVTSGIWANAERAGRAWMEVFEGESFPGRPVEDLRDLGTALRDACFGAFYQEMLAGESHGLILLSSNSPECLNLLWELLPLVADFLGASSRWRLRRRVTHGEWTPSPWGPGPMPFQAFGNHKYERGEFQRST